MALPPKASSGSSRRTLALKLLGGLTALLVVSAIIGYWFVVPSIAEKIVRQQLDRVGSRLGLELTTGSISTSGWQGVTIEDVRVSFPGEEQPFATIGEVRASLDKAQLLIGDKAISFIALSDIELRLVRRADGSLNVDVLRERLQGGGDEDDDESADDTAGRDGGPPSFLRHVGGKWPDIEVQRATLLLINEAGAEPWPLERVYAEAAELSGSRASADFLTTLALTHAPGAPAHSWTLPQTVDIAATFRAPWASSTGKIDFEPPIQVVGLSPFPFVRAGIGSVSVASGLVIEAHTLSLGIESGPYKVSVGEVGRIAVQLNALTRDLSALRILDASIESPSIHMAYAENGANTLELLHHLVRTPVAHHVTNSARAAALDIATRVRSGGTNIAAQADAVAQPSSAGSAGLGDFNWSKFLTEKAPAKVSITGASLTVRDHRIHAFIAKPASVLSLKDARLELTHRPISSELNLEAAFVAEADAGQTRGSATLRLVSNYRSGALEVRSDVDALDLAWLGQIMGPRFSNKVQAGTARVRFELDRRRRDATVDFSGLASIEGGTLWLTPLAEEPMTNLTASYQFEGSYDPKASIPPMRLGKKPGSAPEPVAAALPEAIDQEPDVAPDRAAIPTRGALVFKVGHARLGAAKAEVLPAFYGIEWAKKMPARFDLKVSIPPTPIADLISAVPDPIKGPLAGIRMSGSFGWEFALEAPLYDARNMEWETKPELINLEIVSLPSAVDVFKLTGEFEHTIRDEFERLHKGKRETFEYARRVSIPAQRPIPATWLLENTPLSLEQIDRQRRRRDWPAVPHPGQGLSAEVLRSPQYWLTDDALGQAARLPWRKKQSVPNLSDFDWQDEPDATNVQKRGSQDDTNPYGPYQFVPLHHISPWLVRAILTTEDNSFFTHGGFNWLAMKESVQANLRAGRYVRGASTISMQLAKNLFLDRSKVLSRKFQEAFLVWLMEDVANIPKERLMEIYLNIIEFGPGVFGIHDASVHYFGKRPDELSLSEVIWLVSIVPSPKRYHVYYERGEITESWFKRMTRYMRVMHSRDRVSEAQYLSALEDRPQFYKPETGAPLYRPVNAPEPVLDRTIAPEPLLVPEFPNFFP
ncbi:MAG: transglycosylase domain-containing protein [Bradymonadaceae bacterium]|nr:transglycosylase domain-containing protein [Lujinxingiaceae bacterium]